RIEGMADELPQRFLPAGLKAMEGVEVDAVAGLVERREEAQPLDMIPVEMEKKGVGAKGPPAEFLHQRVPQQAKSCPAIEDHDFALAWLGRARFRPAGPHLDTKGVAAVAKMGRRRRSHRPANSPEPRLHRFCPYLLGPRNKRHKSRQTNIPAEAGPEASGLAVSDFGGMK